MMSMTKEAQTIDQTPETHETLRVRAEAIRINPRENVEDYFDRDMRLRVEMTQAIYPFIDNEVTTVTLMRTDYQKSQHKSYTSPFPGCC